MTTMTTRMVTMMLLVSIIGKLKVCRVGGSSSIGSGRKGSLQMIITMVMTMVMTMTMEMTKKMKTLT